MTDPRPTDPAGHRRPVDAAREAGPPVRDGNVAPPRSPADAVADALAEALGGALLADPGDAAWRDVRFVAWLGEEARSADRRGRRASDAAFLARGEALLARVQARRLGVRRFEAPADEVRTRRGGPGVVREGAAARTARTVAVVELGVAAGPGRELWDEPPERWLRLPDDLPAARYLALRVVGTSMSPMLRSGDVVLVRADARGREPRAGRVVVARHPDDGYVCKQVRRAGADGVELASLEAGHGVLRLPPDAGLVVGTVVAAWPGW